MERTAEGPTLKRVADAMVKLHKEQFGRGPNISRAHFAGADALLCVLEDVLLPAERKMLALGRADLVRDSRSAFQAATGPDFVGAVEEIIGRRVLAFASGVDAEANVVFECFYFAPASSQIA